MLCILGTVVARRYSAVCLMINTAVDIQNLICGFSRMLVSSNQTLACRLSRLHADHIIPQASLTERSLRDQSIPGVKIEAIRQAVNRLGNLQLLMDHDNLGKSDTDLRSWLITRDQEFLDRHMIPSDQSLWCSSMLLEFIEAREDLIRERLRRFLIVDERATLTIAA